MFTRPKLTFSQQTKYLIQGWMKSISKPTLDIPRIVSFLICLYYELRDQWITEQSEANIDEDGMRISSKSQILAFGALKIYTNSTERYEWTFDIQSLPKLKRNQNIRIGLQSSIYGEQFVVTNNGTRLRTYSSGASSIWFRYTYKWGHGDKLKMLYHHNFISFAINNKSYKQTFQLRHDPFSEESYYQLFASLSEKCIIKISKFHVYQ